MKIKSLLIGSAAALVAATGAQAADAVVVAEPEPVEYVRICDAYGAGFFFIPGTETCLRISGYVWFQVWSSGDRTGNVVNPFVTNPYYGGTNIFGQSGLTVGSRARLNFDARSDTEWGTLRSFIRVQGTWTGGFDGNATFDQAFIELGGWRMGYTESAWSQTQGGGASNWGAHSWGGMYYGYTQRQLIAYTFQGGNGFFGTISIEDDVTAGNSWTPDAVIKVGVNQGWGSIWAKVGYDDEILPGPLAACPGCVGDSWSAGLGMQLNVPNSPGSSLRVLAFYHDGPNQWSGGPGVSAWPAVFPLGYEWSILASYNHAFSSTLSASIAFQYFNDAYNPFVAGFPTTNHDAWGAELSVVWFPVTNFEVRAELHYDDVDAGVLTGGLDPDGIVSGFVRFTRYF
ncbi:MAG: porin [Rhizobiaceae bacterium]